MFNKKEFNFVKNGVANGRKFKMYYLIADKRSQFPVTLSTNSFCIINCCNSPRLCNNNVTVLVTNTMLVKNILRHLRSFTCIRTHSMNKRNPIELLDLKRKRLNIPQPVGPLNIVTVFLRIFSSISIWCSSIGKLVGSLNPSVYRENIDWSLRSFRSFLICIGRTSSSLESNRCDF